MEQNSYQGFNEIAERIVRYLDIHPQASDTVEGITQWWIMHQKYLESYQVVEAVLEDLVQRGLVCRTKNKDGTVIYSRKEIVEK